MFLARGRVVPAIVNAGYLCQKTQTRERDSLSKNRVAMAKRKRNNPTPSEALGLGPSGRDLQPPGPIKAPGKVTKVGAAAGRRFAPGWLRLRVLRRDGYRCRSCHTEVTNKTANIDHIKPWPWGLTERRNLQTLCKDCNRNKGARDPDNLKRRRPIHIVSSGSMSN